LCKRSCSRRAYDLDDENDPLYLLIDVVIGSLQAGLTALAGTEGMMERALATIGRLVPSEQIEKVARES
jgi:hypothetical protein